MGNKNNNIPVSWNISNSNTSCRHQLSDQESAYYLIQYPDVLQSCGNNKQNYKCARNHWTKYGCKEGRNYVLPPSCSYVLSDQEAICYIEQNNLGYRRSGNDLNKARTHWQTIGCINNLSYTCPESAEIVQLNQDLKIANSQLSDLGSDYKNFANNVHSKLTNILKLEVTDLPFVFSNVQEQNKKLENQLQNTNDKKLTQDQRAFYIETQNSNLQNFNSILNWFYYVVLFIFIGVLFLMKKNLDLYRKIFLVLFFLSFPFFIYYIEYALWFIGHYLVSLFYSKIFII
jgi:hypothetical protein